MINERELIVFELVIGFYFYYFIFIWMTTSFLSSGLDVSSLDPRKEVVQVTSNRKKWKWSERIQIKIRFAN